MPPRIAAVDHTRKRFIDDEPIEIDERDVRLAPQRLAHRVVRHEAQRDENFAKWPLVLFLMRERLFELIGGDRTAPQQHVAEPQTIATRLDTMEMRRPVCVGWEVAQRPTTRHSSRVSYRPLKVCALGSAGRFEKWGSF